MALSSEMQPQLHRKNQGHVQPKKMFLGHNGYYETRPP